MTKGIEDKRTYKTQLDSFWRGFWLARAGYPKIDLEKFQIISTDTVRHDFETGRGEPIQLFPKQQ
ncbi:MAG: hypothetical protein ACREAU_00075 [Nitrosopumilaceae archaeon]